MMDLKKIQEEIYQNKIDKGFNVDDISMEFCLMNGEMSEAYEAWIKKQNNLGEEMADIAIYLLGLAQILDINLEQEILKKIEINKDRTYDIVDGIAIKKDKKN